jgi:hypothetical protein
MSSLPQALQDFFAEQKARYGNLFWCETKPGNRLVFMLEALAQEASEILNRFKANDLKVVSFEADDLIGDWYIVEADQIDMEQRPGREEYQDITDKELDATFIDLTNDLYQSQVIRVYRPQGYSAWCAVARHSFGPDIPRGPIGWLKGLAGLRPYKQGDRLGQQQLSDLKKVCQAFEGVVYRLGGGSFKNGFDCSSLVQRIIYQTRGFWLPRKARWQRLVCDKVPLENLQPGDLVFFNKKDDSRKQIDHVALVYEPRRHDLPVVFHAKRINGRAQFDDLKTVSWLGIWEINSFGRICQPREKFLV